MSPIAEGSDPDRKVTSTTGDHTTTAATSSAASCGSRSSPPAAGPANPRAPFRGRLLRRLRLGRGTSYCDGFQGFLLDRAVPLRRLRLGTMEPSRGRRLSSGRPDISSSLSLRPVPSLACDRPSRMVVPVGAVGSDFETRTVHRLGSTVQSLDVCVRPRPHPSSVLSFAAR